MRRGGTQVLHGTMVRTLAATAASVLLLGGCGFTDGAPAVSTQDEVVDALLVLRDGARARGTAELTVDEDELRDVLRNDPEALELLRDLTDSEGAQDTDELLLELEAAQAQLARQALVLEIGADTSARIAAERDGTVWADLRIGTDAAAGDDLADGASIDLQLQVDWATAAQVLDEPDLLGQLDGAIAIVRGFGSGPELAAVTELATAFLAGELVGISGVLTPELLSTLGVDAGDLPGAEDALGMAAELDPRELVSTAFTFDGFRHDGDDTVVDVTLEIRAIGEMILDELSENPSAGGMTSEEVEAARAELDELPERLDDVATLRLDDAGTISTIRVDLLDLGLQLTQAADDGDAELATAQRVAAQLDATGMFLVLDVTDVGAVPSVLGDPTTAVTPEQLADAVGALFLGAFNGFAQTQADLLGDLEG